MARGRHQRGWLRREKRSEGETWMLYFRVTRESDSERVEHKVPVGLVRKFPSKAAAWKEVARLHLDSQINEPDFRGRITFADLARHYQLHELGEQGDAADPKAHTTIAGYKRVLRNRLIPRWGERIALDIQPLEIEQWLKGLKREESLENPTLDRMRRVMNLVYKHGQRYGLIPRSEEANPLRFVRCKTQSDYEALIITPQQAFELLLHMPEPERTLTLLASGTGLRISECLGLQWADVNFAESQIQVRRTWILGKVGKPKSKASKAPVPLHPLLAEFLEVWKRETPYSQLMDWVFPSMKLKGKQPRVANVLVKHYVRVAAAKAGILSSHRNEKGDLVEDDPRRFGFHNLRHSLASFLVRSKIDPKTVQSLLRHADVRTTLQLYAHSLTEDRLAAQELALQAILGSGRALLEPANC